ncbi:MAG TPA: hypothetical protein VE359_01780 [Vicinamibacteria bacterium]|jgi:hypothetical protein|nr:hypothetical protein [Vicinamibacteria bacterium]
MNRRFLLAWIAVAAAVIAPACGGGSPSSPSGSGGVAVQGVVLGDGTSFTASSGAKPSTAQAQKIKVMVAGTSITAEVAANGTFELKGIPSGSFTLIFLVDGVEIGRIVINAPEGSEVKLVVQVKNSVLVVVEIKVETGGIAASPSPTPTSSACFINGGTVGQGIELEGDVTGGTSAAFKMAVNGRADTPIDVNASSASFRCIGGAKVPTDADCRASVKAGAKVHVSGRLDSCTPLAAVVAAAEVKIQKS